MNTRNFMVRLTAATSLSAAVATAVLMAPAPSHAADPVTTSCIAAYDSSVSLRHEHKLRAARAQLLICAAPDCPTDIRNECTWRVVDVNAATPTIVFDAKDAAGRDISGVKVSMDGQPLAEKLAGTAISIDPGEHSFIFEAAGHEKIQRKLVINEGEKGRRERITFMAVAPAAPQTAMAAPQTPAAEKAAPPIDSYSLHSNDLPGLGPQKIGAITAAGVGVVGVGVGAVFGLQAMSKRSAASNVCPDQCADQSGADLWKSAKTAGNMSTAAFIVGGVGLAAGAVLWFTAAPKASTHVGVGPGSIELRGSW
jgi:hypothetical protein